MGTLMGKENPSGSTGLLIHNTDDGEAAEESSERAL